MNFLILYCVYLWLLRMGLINIGWLAINIKLFALCYLITFKLLKWDWWKVLNDLLAIFKLLVKSLVRNYIPHVPLYAYKGNPRSTKPNKENIEFGKKYLYFSI